MTVNAIGTELATKVSYAKRKQIRPHALRIVLARSPVDDRSTVVATVTTTGLEMECRHCSISTQAWKSTIRAAINTNRRVPQPLHHHLQDPLYCPHLRTPSSAVESYWHHRASRLMAAAKTNSVPTRSLSSVTGLNPPGVLSGSSLYIHTEFLSPFAVSNNLPSILRLARNSR
uniref:Uncharacterized protein n=1 Tax=Cannabis sativa TaxID=3483 RepID=A0A803Q9I4_CANSA